MPFVFEDKTTIIYAIIMATIKHKIFFYVGFFFYFTTITPITRITPTTIIAIASSKIDWPSKPLTGCF